MTLETAFVDYLLQLYDDNAFIFISSFANGDYTRNSLDRSYRFQRNPPVYILSLNEGYQWYHCVFFPSQKNARIAHQVFPLTIGSIARNVRYPFGTQHLSNLWKQQLLWTRSQLAADPNITKTASADPQNHAIFWEIDIEHLREAANRVRSLLSPQGVPSSSSSSSSLFSSSSTSSFVTAPESAPSEEAFVLSLLSPASQSETPTTDSDSVKTPNVTPDIDMLFDHGTADPKDRVDSNGMRGAYHPWPVEADDDLI